MSGIVRRGGRPLPNVWVSYWWRREQERNVVNAYIQRGRTVRATGVNYRQALTDEAGRYKLNVHDPGQYFFIVEASDTAPTITDPIKISRGEEKELNIDCTAGGSILGRVTNVAAPVAGGLWVVAFNRTVYRAETPVGPDGGFRFEHLPPGEYGLKVGHDGFEDSEVPRWKNLEDFQKVPKETRDSWWKTLAEPWKRATVVTVESGRNSERIELELPPK